MPSVKELLVNALKELEENDLKEFQWHLKNDHECIPKSVMEKADILKTVDKMVERFRPEEAVKNTVKILRKMNQNYLAEQLESKHKEVSLRDIKQSPERNNSDTHTAGFSKHLEKDELRMNNVQFFNNNLSGLIQRVTNIGVIADKLRQKGIIHKEKYSEITHKGLTSQESMRKICDIIDKLGDAGKADFISILQEEERFLLDHW